MIGLGRRGALKVDSASRNLLRLATVFVCAYDGGAGSADTEQARQKGNARPINNAGAET